MRNVVGVAAAIGLAMLTLPAQAQHAGHAAGPKATDTAATRAYRAADAAMMSRMDLPYTGDPDVDFRLHMIPHHEGAIAMARVAIAHARDAATTALARTIIADQEREIGEMRAWLAARGHR